MGEGAKPLYRVGEVKERSNETDTRTTRANPIHKNYSWIELVHYLLTII